MPKIRHPLSGAVYDLHGDGMVVVEKEGRFGRFDREANWISGELRTADPELCRWVSDPRAASHRRQAVENQGPPSATVATGATS